jgi:hypothetical protein
MNTVNYTEKKTFEKYNDGQYLLYLNEAPVTFTLSGNEPGEEQELQGFSYTGDAPDGATVIEAKDVTDENRRGKFVAGLINKNYSIDAQIALLSNGNDTPQHAEELHAFEAYRAECKTKVDELLSR